MADLLVIVPSRGRPQNIVDLQDSFYTTFSGNADLLVAIDDDDPELPEYEKALHDDTLLDVAPRSRLGPTLNRLAHELASDYFAIGFMGDDHRPRTHSWDSRFLSELYRLGTGLVYGNDLLQREKLPTEVAMTANIVRRLGYMVPPTLTHMYLDNFWLALGRRLGITYLGDIVIEHMHPFAGKAEMDGGYSEVNAPEMYAHDKAAFVEYMSRHFETDVRKMIPAR